MEKLYISKAFMKMGGGRMHASHPTPCIRPWPLATETTTRAWHISVTWHQ